MRGFFFNEYVGIRMARLFIVIAATSGFLAVSIGAFAAHGLKKILSEDLLAIVQLAAHYQMIHALALFGVGLFIYIKPGLSGLKTSGFAFLAGSLLFSGSLYALAMGGPRWLGPVTPVGGVCFLVGWFSLAFAAIRWTAAPPSPSIKLQ